MLEIRKFKFEELEICARIYATSWKSAFCDSQRQIDIIDFLNETAGELIYVAERDNNILGYISIWEPEWFIHHLYVEPSQQGQGIGKALLSYAEVLANRQLLILKCQLENKRAIKFYHAVGFVESNEKGIDENGEWIKLIKNINNGD